MTPSAPIAIDAGLLSVADANSECDRRHEAEPPEIAITSVFVREYDRLDAGPWAWVRLQHHVALARRNRRGNVLLPGWWVVGKEVDVVDALLLELTGKRCVAARRQRREEAVNAACDDGLDEACRVVWRIGHPDHANVGECGAMLCDQRASLADVDACMAGSVAALESEIVFPSR